MVRRGTTTTIPNLTALAFYNNSTGEFSIVGHNKGTTGITINGEIDNLSDITSLSFYQTNTSGDLQHMNDVVVEDSYFTAAIPADTFFYLYYPGTQTPTPIPSEAPTDTPIAGATSTATPTGTPSATPTGTPSPIATSTSTFTTTPTRTPTAFITNTPTRTATITLTPNPVEIINPADIAALPSGTDVLINFDNFPNPSDGRAIPAGYAGCTWNNLIEGSPWAGVTTWNFYITNGGAQGTVVFPRPVIVKSIRVSSGSSNIFTLSSAGNQDISTTTSGSSPQTLVTGWINPITALTLRSSSSDQVFDDLRLTTSGSSQITTQTPTSTATATRTPTPSRTPTPTRTYTASPTNTRTPTPTNTRTVVASITPSPTRTPASTATNTPSPTNTPTQTAILTPTSTPTDTPVATGTPSATSPPGGGAMIADHMIRTNFPKSPG